MAYDSHKNFAKGTLTNSPGTGGTSFILGSGEGALFAANTPVTIVPANTQPLASNSEIGYVTAVSTDTLTVTRAQQSTSAVNAIAGWVVMGTITAKALTDIETAVDNLNQDDVADGTTYKQYSATEKTKLAGVATGATANDTDANLKARANHTGTQLLSTISDVTASATELNYVDGVTSAIQTQLDAKVTGPASATNNAIAVWDTTTGKLLKNSSGSISAANLTGISSIGGSALPGGDFVGTSDTQTLTNKTLTTPVISSTGASFGGTLGATTLKASSTASGALTLPAATDTLVGKATTDTLTNKTISTGSTIDANVTVTEVLKKVYPVGSIYASTVSTSPATLFGFGTWSAYAAGRVMVGKAASGTFNTAGATGGAENHSHTQGTLYAAAEMFHVSGTNYIDARLVTGGSYTATDRFAATGTTSASSEVQTSGIQVVGTTDMGSSLLPYIVTYLWQRTA